MGKTNINSKFIEQSKVQFKNNKQITLDKHRVLEWALLFGDQSISISFQDNDRAAVLKNWLYTMKPVENELLKVEINNKGRWSYTLNDKAKQLMEK